MRRAALRQRLPPTADHVRQVNQTPSPAASADGAAGDAAQWLRRPRFASADRARADLAHALPPNSSEKHGPSTGPGSTSAALRRMPCAACNRMHACPSHGCSGRPCTLTVVSGPCGTPSRCEFMASNTPKDTQPCHHIYAQPLRCAWHVLLYPTAIANEPRDGSSVLPLVPRMPRLQSPHAPSLLQVTSPRMSIWWPQGPAAVPSGNLHRAERVPPGNRAEVPARNPHRAEVPAACGARCHAGARTPDSVCGMLCGAKEFGAHAV